MTMHMLTSSLVSDSIVDTFVVVYKFAFDFSLYHRKVMITVNCCIAITLIIGSLSVFFWIRISIQYFCLNFSIKY